MKNDREKKNTDAAKKGLTGDILPYEKPRLESVRLFADQVLETCNKNVDGCGGYPPGLS